MSSRSRAVRGCVMFRRMGKVSHPCKSTIEALRVCFVNMMYFSIFIVFVRPNVTGSLRFSTWRIFIWREYFSAFDREKGIKRIEGKIEHLVYTVAKSLSHRYNCLQSTRFLSKDGKDGYFADRTQCVSIFKMGWWKNTTASNIAQLHPRAF